MVLNYSFPNIFKSCMRTLYPFFSLAVIEIGTWIESLNNLTALLILTLQFTIGILTIIKIIKDIKHHKKINTEKELKEIKKKHPVLTAILELLKLKK